MKTYIKNLEWWFDYYLGWMFFNPHYEDYYIDYLKKKWPDKVR